MLFKTALRIVVHEKDKFAGAVAGVSIALFLMILQWSFYLGFDRDTTVVLDSIDADIWIVPRNQPDFDGWGRFDDLPYLRAREHPAVVASGRVVWAFAPFRVPGSGGLETVEVLGMEFGTGINLRLDLPRGDMASLLKPDGHILLSEGDREKLGVSRASVYGVEINAIRATPVGFVPGVHLFTTACFVLTDLDNGRRFLNMPAAHASYVVCRCRPGANISQVVAELQRTIPEHEVLVAEQFHDRAAGYWKNRTSIGTLLVFSSSMAVAVGFLIVMLAFYVSTIEKIPVFACMKALGASNREVVGILVMQAVIVFALGCVVAGLMLGAALAVLAHTTISVVITKNLIFTGLLATAGVSAGSSLLSVRRVLAADPGEAFRS